MVKATFLNLPEDKRARIIDVALEEFASRPYNKASLSNIVARAGIAKGSMYQYFTDKKDLFLYLLDLAGEQKLAYIRHEVDSQADFFEMFEQSMLAGTRFSLERPVLSQVMANAMASSAEEVLQEVTAQGKRMSIEFFTQMLAEGQRKGTVRQDINVRLAANVLYSMLSQGLLDYLLEILDVTIHELLVNPQVGAELTEDRIKSIIEEVMKIMRYGLENTNQE